VDGQATTSTSGVRRFVTPALEAGKTFYYTLEAKQGGVTSTTKVAVRAGEEATVQLAISSTETVVLK